MPDVRPIPPTIQLDRAFSGYRAASRTPPRIDSVVPGRIGRYECGIGIFAAVVVGPRVSFGAVGLGVAPQVGAGCANIDSSIHATPEVLPRVQRNVGGQPEGLSQKRCKSGWSGGGAAERSVDGVRAGAIRERILNSGDLSSRPECGYRVALDSYARSGPLRPLQNEAEAAHPVCLQSFFVPT